MLNFNLTDIPYLADMEYLINFQWHAQYNQRTRFTISMQLMFVSNG
jgi:hypothetical protein